MEKENSKSFIKGTPARIIPAGQTDLYEIKVEEAPLSPFLVGRTVTVDLPAEIRAEIGRQTGVNMSYDAEYQVSGFFKSLRVEGFVGTVFSKFEPFTQHEKSSFFRSFVRSAEGKLLFSMDISDIRVLIGEPVSAAFANRVRPERPRFPVWLSPKEQMRILAYGQTARTAFVLQVNQELKDLLDTCVKDLRDDSDNKDRFDPEYGDHSCDDGPDCESCGITCCENNPAYRYEDDIESEDDFECTGDCENCPVTFEEDEDEYKDDGEDDFEHSGMPKDFGTLFAEAWGCGQRQHAEKPVCHADGPVKEEILAFDDCPFTGDGGKYFKAFIGAPGGKKAKKRIKDYINTICKVCRHNEECNSDHVTNFFLMNDTADQAYISRFGNRTYGNRHEVYIGQSGDRSISPETDTALPDYFGQPLYSFEDKIRKNPGKKGRMSYAGLFVKNFTGSVTLIPGILPLFDPKAHTLTCIEICGLPEEAFNALYKIINSGGCPAVYVSIPEEAIDLSYASTEEIDQMYIRGEKEHPMSPCRIIICEAAEGYSADLTVSAKKIGKNTGSKGKK